jgi:hypothetical protein
MECTGICGISVENVVATNVTRGVKTTLRLTPILVAHVCTTTGTIYIFALVDKSGHSVTK